MIGSIDCRKKCACGGNFKFDENRNALFCKKCDHRCTGPFRVRFGRKICRNFGNDFRAAETFLLHLRHEATTQTFDARDYQELAPLSFANQSAIWLDYKKGSVSAKVLKNMELVMTRAAKVWGNRNVKDIRSSDIEDFLFRLPVGSKTRHNYKSYLFNFWKWLHRRELLPMPQFPEVSFKLGWRQIIDIPTQQAIIEEVKRQNTHNPKGWLAIRMLSRYFHIRPGELMRITEGNINLDIPAMILPPQSSKIGEPVMIFLWDDDIEEIAKFPRGLPNLPFFRHPQSTRAESGKPFGQRYLYKLWTNACKALGLMRSDTLPICDLYAGTRHSTITAMGEVMSPEEVQQASGHRTSQALTRYLQGRSRYAQKAMSTIAKIQNQAGAEVKRLDQHRKAQ